MSSVNTVSWKIYDNVSEVSLHNTASELPAGLGFLNLDWYAAWDECYLPVESPGTSVQCIAVENNANQALAVCPYFVKTIYGIKLFSIAGYYYPFRSLLVAKESIVENTQGIVNAILHSHVASIVRFGPTEENNPVTRTMNTSFSQLGWKCFQQDRGEQYFIELPDEFERYKSSLSKKMLGNLRRDTNKLAKIGAIEFRKYNNLNAGDWMQVIEDCSEVERNSWLDAASQGKMRIHGKEAFWKRLLENESTSKRISIWVMYLDTKPISFNVAIDADGYRYGMSSQYDAAYRKYSVGLAMHFHVIEDAIESGIKTFNMGDGDSGYKQRWGAVPGVRLIDYIYFKPNLIGNFFYAGLMLKEKLEDLIHTSRSRFKIPPSFIQSLSQARLAKK